ncbi:hypothetical protein ABVT39_003028 [Epinephelus coioides]
MEEYRREHSSEEQHPSHQFGPESDANEAGWQRRRPMGRTSTDDAGEVGQYHQGWIRRTLPAQDAVVHQSAWTQHPSEVSSVGRRLRFGKRDTLSGTFALSTPAQPLKTGTDLGGEAGRAGLSTSKTANWLVRARRGGEDTLIVLPEPRRTRRTYVSG